MKPKRAKKLIYFLGIMGFLMMLLCYLHIIFLPIGLVVAASSVVLSLLFYKCPYCGKHLGRNGGDYCPYCGKRIED